MNKTRFKPSLNSLTPSRAQGFTLLELLIVIVIVAILFSFATLTIRSSSPEDSIKEEAQRLHRLIQLALEEAVMKNTEYGLEFKTNSYRFLSYNEAEWQAINDDVLLKERELPDDMEIELLIEQVDVIIGETADNNSGKYGLDASMDSEAGEDKAKPQVFLLSSEEITPEFSARFFLPGIETSYIVSGSIDGKSEISLSDF